MVTDKYLEPRKPKRARNFQNQKQLEKGENFGKHLSNNNGDNNSNTEGLISIISLNSMDRGIVSITLQYLQ